MWATELSLRIGSAARLTPTCASWVNEGLMTLFFLVVGLEAKRELDLGELRERRRLAIPVLAAHRRRSPARSRSTWLNAGGPGAHGWGAAMSTDTAFALGVPRLLIARARRRACACSCSRSRWSTTSPRCW